MLRHVCAASNPSLDYEPVEVCLLPVKATICFHRESNRRVSLEWKQGSEDRRLADGSQTKPDAMSCSGFPTGPLPSPWAVTQSTTNSPTHRPTQTQAYTVRRKMCQLVCLLKCEARQHVCICVCIACYSSLISAPLTVIAVGKQLRVSHTPPSM